MNVTGIWRDLEAEEGAEGTYRRRVHPEAVADLFLVVYKPSNMRAFLVDVDLSDAGINELPTGQGIELRWVHTSKGQAMELVLSQNAFSDLFDALVTDVAEVASRGSDDRDAARRVAGRVRRWQTFLRASGTGLSGEQQRGLYGELYFLRRFLLPNVEHSRAVASWVGPRGAHQDFSFGVLAIEAKTTNANQHQVVRITSERQLDTTALDELVVFHLSVDGREGSGVTLPELVEGLRSDLSGSALDAFEDLLFTAGYLDAHARLYVTGYTIREANLFRVREGFPRLVEADCAPGVGDVTYSIGLGALQAFLIERSALGPLLRKAVGGGS